MSGKNKVKALKLTQKTLNDKDLEGVIGGIDWHNFAFFKLFLRGNSGFVESSEKTNDADGLFLKENKM